MSSAFARDLAIVNHPGERHRQRFAGALRTLSHGGGVSGYTCEIAFDPESKVGVILLRNYNSGRTPLQAITNQTVRTSVAERKAAGLQ